MKKAQRLLYRSFDTGLSPEEDAELKRSLSQSEELRKELICIDKLRKAVSQVEIEGFQPFFVERVMARIREKEATSGVLFTSLYRAFRWALIPSLALLLGIFIRNVSSADGFSIRSAIGLPEVTVGDVLEPQTDLIMVEAQ